MLTLNDATKILELCNIPVVIQNKILLSFISFGTPESHIIKKYITAMNNDDMMNDTYIMNNDNLKTLWRYKVTLTNCRKLFRNSINKQNIIFLYELSAEIINMYIFIFIMSDQYIFS